MYYRKIEDNKRHFKLEKERCGWIPGWWFNEDLGYYQYTKKHSNNEKYWKNHSNRIVRHNKNDYYLTKSNLYQKEFDYWWTLW